VADQIRAPIAKLHYRLAAVDDGVLTQEIESDGRSQTAKPDASLSTNARLAYSSVPTQLR